MSPSPVFDEIIHAPNRLKICALLATATSAEFGTLRDALGVADSVTSKHLRVLTDAGYVRLSKPTGTGGRAKTWATLTPSGRKAFLDHLTMLQQMATDASPASPAQ
jgi:DNA-binding MarR family transcriptional regulator